MPTGITLTPTYIRIIKKLIFKAKLIPMKRIVGLTKTGLDSKGISRTTVKDNLEELLANHLIKTVYVDDKKGPYPWIYYDATPQGVIALLKTFNINEISKEFNQEILGRFFPLITLHWDELIEIIGKGIPFFLKLAVEQIEINNYYAEGEPIGHSSPLQFLTESMNIYFSDDFAIKLKTRSLPFYKDDFTNNKLMIEGKYLEVEQRISRIITFLFYFNLIKFPLDKTLDVVLYFLDSLGPLSLENVKNKNFRPLIDMNNYKKEDIISIINHDNELYSIVKVITKEIYKKMHISKPLKYLHDKTNDTNK